jgi:nucleotide-binding universal stress UspA family protein
MLNLRRILVAVDFTETSDKAFDFAVELAQKFGATVTAVHAFEIPVVGFPDGALVATADVATRIQEAAKQGLDAAVKARQGKGVEVTGVLREGSPHEEVKAVAEQMGMDLIVIGTHGRKGLARALLGSVAENVVRTVKLPVLTIHGPRD